MKDTRSAGPSKLVPYKQGEDARDRHARRLRAANDAFEHVNDIFLRAGIALVVRNLGQHWTFTKGKQVAEWWPSTAKLVFDRRYARGIHVHDCTQALHLIAKRWRTG